MFCIVPLAGPDFHHPSYGTKPFVRIDGKSLIESTIGARPWLLSGQLQTRNIVFVLRDTAQTPEAIERLGALFPGCAWVVVSKMTAGALLSALAGAALQRHFESPLVIDLADIIYDSDIGEISMSASEVGGAIPWFRASDPAYSYLRIENGTVTETREKVVISEHASAGTYFFRNLAVFIDAVAAAAAHPERYNVGQSIFVCPVYNVLIAKGWHIAQFEVRNPIAVSKRFHDSAIQETT